MRTRIARELVPPPRQITGTEVPLRGKMFKLLGDIYADADAEMKREIAFKHAADGGQQNDCRDLITGYVTESSFPNGKKIAERLQQHTDQRSGPGLLFLIVGREGRDHKIVISRFPTDTAVLVEENPRTLDVAFLDRVFMKNKSSYKAVTYSDSSLRTGFWSGRAIDKQSGPPAELSDYWTVHFLLSTLKTTPSQGTERFASALRAAAQHSELPVKEELIAAATLAPGIDGEIISIVDFERRYNLSPAASAAIRRELRNPEAAEEEFQFVGAEFTQLLAYRSKELSNGAVLIGPSATYQDVFVEEVIDRATHEVRITTQGRVINDKLKPTKA